MYRSILLLVLIFIEAQTKGNDFRMQIFNIYSHSTCLPLPQIHDIMAKDQPTQSTVATVEKTESTKDKEEEPPIEEGNTGEEKNETEIHKNKFNRYLIGGKRAQKYQFPYQVGLIQKSTDQFFCGGSIITKKHVLSGAHCFCHGEYYKPAMDIVVGGGGIELGNIIVKPFDIQRVACHPEYDNITYYHDIAILTIKKTFEFSKGINMIKLATAGYDEHGPLLEDLSVTISGWGTDRFRSGTPAPVLQYIITKTIDLQKCKDMFASDMAKCVMKWNFCTFNPKRPRTCSGDSGGPVVYQGLLVGVVSWSRQCNSGAPGVHTSIAHHYDWILEECKKDKY